MTIKERSAGAVIFRRNSDIKYLLLKYGLGHWDFVKGNIEKGEKEKETVIRETKEETGIDDLVFIPGFRERITYFYRRGKELVFKEVVFYLAETRKKDVVLSYEHADYVWLCFEDAINRLTYKNSKEVLKKAHKYLMS